MSRSNVARRRIGAGPPEREKEFQSAVLDLARVTGWKLRYHTLDSRGSSAGFPDLVLIRPPRIILAELKSEAGRLSGEQALWLEGLWACPGVEAYLWRPADWPQIEQVLSRKRAGGEP